MWYLYIIEDLFTGEVVGWAVSNNVDTQLRIDCVTSMVNSIRAPIGALRHSDQGSTYTLFEYKALLVHLGFRQSCSSVGQCWEIIMST